ncbi:hypothetical protein ABVF02_07705 [Lacticaseibacillus paracasei]|uniref:hypothetical protein n=1 Tax=Lacticaseibacillus paracasei TaxID=1597 RepID=UPI00338FF55B
MDFASGWLIKSASTPQTKANIHATLVETNSIHQGEQTINLVETIICTRELTSVLPSNLSYGIIVLQPYTLSLLDLGS